MLSLEHFSGILLIRSNEVKSAKYFKMKLHAMKAAAGLQTIAQIHTSDGDTFFA